jgi:hypothetical protein
MMEGAREGLTLAKRSFLTGEPGDAVSKVEANNYQAIPGRAGEIIRTTRTSISRVDLTATSVALLPSMEGMQWAGTCALADRKF